MKNTITNSLKILGENAPMEVRMLHVAKKGTVSGYYDDYEKAERDLKQYDGETNIFITLNKISPEITARSKNHLTFFAKHTTTDREIVRRKWILVDLDPERPAGISSTQVELEHGKKLSEKIWKYLSNLGFSEPIYAMSGNGYHLLYRIDLPNSSESTDLVKQFLCVLNRKFSTANVKVDTSTYNAARIIKLYGTIACKGDNTEERPHRRSYIISAPETSEPNSEQMLQKVLSDNFEMEDSTNKEKFAKCKNQIDTQSGMDVKIWLDSNNIEIDHEKPYDEGRICYVLKKCPWKPEEHADKSAYVIQFAEGQIVAGCHHDSCSNENWASLRKLYSQKKVSKKGDSITESASYIILESIENRNHRFFHSKEGDSYVCMSEESMVVYMPLQDKQFKQYLRSMYYSMHKKAISKDVLQQVIDTLEAKAMLEGDEQEVYFRCKMENQKIYYHLADEEQTVICVDKEGYQPCSEPPIAFLKRKSMLAQVFPQKGKSLRKLTAKHWKFQTTADKLLHDVVLVTRFITDFPMPIVVYMGERGSAKTSAMKLDKLLIDPDTFLVKALNRSVNDLLTTLSKQYLVCYDNVDTITAEMSDLFCICSTGGFYGKRKLYSDGEEYGVNLKTGINFSCINMLTDRPDFYDRCVALTLNRLTSAERKTEEAVMTEFKKDIPFLLGAIFKILSQALSLFEETNLKELPRMADFAHWGYVVAEILGYGGSTFLEAYEKNQNDLNAKVLEEDLIATTLISFIKEWHYCRGSVTELLQELTIHAEKNGVDIRYGWIKSPNVLSKRLNNLQSVLEEINIHFFRGKTDGQRYIELWEGEYPDEE